MTITLPIRLMSVANGSHGHWTARHGRNKKLRGITAMAVRRGGSGSHPASSLPPCVVMLTRVSPGTLDTDNLAYAFKAVRDGVADGLGIKDNDPRIEWRYAQERGKSNEYAVRIQIERAVVVG